MKLSGYMICFNEHQLIELSVNNLLHQTDEVIVVDGNSTDGTLDILNRMAEKDSRVKVYIKEQKSFRDRNLQNSHQYIGTDGFDEIDRRNYAMDQCSGDYILMKDVDELYHESFSIKGLLAKRPRFISYNHLQYEVIDSTQYLSDVLISAHHVTPRLIKHDPRYRFSPNPARRFGGVNIDCMLLDTHSNRLVSSINDMIGAFHFWHYKLVFNKAMHDHLLSLPEKRACLKKLTDMPQQHDAFIKCGLGE